MKLATFLQPFHRCSGNRDALLLTAGKLMRISLVETDQANQGERLGDALDPIGPSRYRCLCWFGPTSY
jgi:hypothetical protein